MTSRARNVGAARRLGTGRALEHVDDPRTMWLANTDADSRVPADWLTQMIVHADQGVDLILGTVRPRYGLPLAVQQAWFKRHHLQRRTLSHPRRESRHSSQHLPHHRRLATASHRRRRRSRQSSRPVWGPSRTNCGDPSRDQQPDRRTCPVRLFQLPPQSNRLNTARAARSARTGDSDRIEATENNRGTSQPAEHYSCQRRQAHDLSAEL